MNNTKQFCPICQTNTKHDRFLTHVKQKFYSYDLVLCNECDLVTQHPPLNDQIAKEYYSADYNLSNYQNNLSNTFEIMLPLSKLRMQFIKEKIGRIPKSCIEIGPGSGTLLSLLQEAGAQTFGIEPDPTAAQWMKDTKHLNIFNGFLDDFMENGTCLAHLGKYELVILSHVLEHIRQPAIFLKNIQRLLSTENGWLYIEVPNIEKPYSGDARWQEYCDPGHYYYFSPITLTKLLNANEIKVEYLETDKFHPYYPIFCLGKVTSTHFNTSILPSGEDFNSLKIIWLKFISIHLLYFPLRRCMYYYRYLKKQFRQIFYVFYS